MSEEEEAQECESCGLILLNADDIVEYLSENVESNLFELDEYREIADLIVARYGR